MCYSVIVAFNCLVDEDYFIGNQCCYLIALSGCQIPVLKEPLDITTAQPSVPSGNYIPRVKSGYQHKMGAFQDFLFLNVSIFVLQSDKS